MERWAGKIALVTGISQGCGFAISKSLLECNLTVIGCARNSTNLETARNELAKQGLTRLSISTCDISNENEVIKLYETIEKEHGGIDILINNAGLARAAPVLSGSFNDWKLMFDVNVLGVLNMTKHGVQSMKKRESKASQIINISSIMAHQFPNRPETHVYSASKHALRSLTQSTKFEVAKEEGLMCKVSEISPGLIETNFAENKYLGDKSRAEQSYRRYKPLAADDIAQAVIYQLSTPPHVQVEDIIMKSYYAPG